MRGLALALLTTLAGCDGCSCQDKPKPAAAPERAAPERDRPARERVGPPDRDRPRPPRIERPVRRSAPLDLPVATAALPAFGTDLAPPAASPSGNQVRFTRCVAAADLFTAGDSVRAALEAGGWARLATRPPEGAQTVARYGLAAEKDDLRLSVTLRSVRRTGCDETIGQYFAVATMNRLAPPGGDDDGDGDGDGALAPDELPPENE